MQAKMINMKLNLVEVKEEKIVLKLEDEKGRDITYDTNMKINSMAQKLVKNNCSEIVAHSLYESFLEVDKDDYIFVEHKGRYMPDISTEKNIRFFTKDFDDKCKSILDEFNIE